VAEHAIARTLERGEGRAFYTTPIKALSNQKYRDLVAVHGADQVGLLTGDNAVNGDAPVVVMTTEVLRNMIYAGRSLDDLEFVVLDEVHYLQDAYRGPVWEEVIIHVPAHVRLVCLSATVSNTTELAEWLRTVRGATDAVLEDERPVELEHLYLVGDKQSEHLHLLPTLVDDGPNPEADRFDSDRVRGRRQGRGRPRRRFFTPGRVAVVEELAHAGLLPTIDFIFSRKGCDEAGRVVTAAGLRLTSALERQRIAEIVDDHLVGLSTDDLTALAYDSWRAGLDQGIATHHAGLVPPFKEAVEQCFIEGLVKVVFATETLALGINMPARSVVIENLSKFTGESHELLTPGQYTQLTGRAGRRGIDDHGTAIVLWSPFVAFGQVAGLASSKRFELKSAFRPTYNMAANLVRRHDPAEAHRLLNLSFAQFQGDRAVVTHERELDVRRDRLARLRARATCERGDVEEYLAIIERDGGRRRRRTPRGLVERGLARLHPGDVLELEGTKVTGRVAVLSVAQRRGGAVQVRVITRRAKVLRLGAADLQDEPLPVDRVELPEPYVPNDEGFRRSVAEQLSGSTGKGSVGPSGPEDDDEHPVASCPEVDDHLRAARRARRLTREIKKAERRRKHERKSLADQFDRVLELLERWGYLEGWALTGRGDRLASVYHESDLLVTEALEQGLFDDLDAAALAALVSCLTYEHRSPDDPPPPWFPSTALRRRFDELVHIADRLRGDEEASRLPLTRPPEAGFVPLAFGWAGGEDLADVLDDEDLSGGDFVRNVRQLLDLLRQVAELAPDPRTMAAARKAGEQLSRGVVSASSDIGVQW
jgi:ATP-dependent RNA helicase HelY